ncbi:MULTISPECIES: YggT family protein [Ectothiorhodospira]|uniref:YggT family protein n=1 Tax=Ectothiorhodospira marina TaxID=1396821 RepID=A0A1H7JIN4_9GAMM|nr:MULTISPECIES: YggT family protein [Ectothiorhodospira]MCG5514722.1 YggT family protein [Ectothiorhodospira sp. 9100]MCG5518321.1 YggT family protein [Ectothiorhodospira sp. 9905]SEK73820.1 YggT family protein [Ectothiorhodospira marina]
MTHAFQNVADFLISTLFSLYILAVMLRTLLAMSRADFYNPVSQFLVTITNPPLRVLRRVIPPMGRIDTAAFVLVLVLKMLEIWLITLLHGVGIPLFTLFMVSVLALIRLVIWIYIISIIIQAVMSWFQAGGAMGRNPVADLVFSLNRPILAPIRNIMPQTGMVDLSPLVAIIILNVLLIFVGSI